MNCVKSVPLMAALLYLRESRSNESLARELTAKEAKITPAVLSSFLNGNRFFDQEFAEKLTKATDALLGQDKVGWDTEQVPPKILYDPNRGIRAQRSIGAEALIPGHGKKLSFREQQLLSGIWRSFYFPNLEKSSSTLMVTSNLIFIKAFQLTEISRAVLYRERDMWEALIHVVGGDSDAGGLVFIMYWSCKTNGKIAESAVSFCRNVNTSGGTLIVGLSNRFRPSEQAPPFG